MRTSCAATAVPTTCAAVPGTTPWRATPAATGCSVTAGDDSLDGGRGDDLLVGGGGSDTLTGGGGVDQLRGGGGADVLDGKAGQDVMTGGPGADVFAFSVLDGNVDRILDFAEGEDRLDLGAMLPGFPARRRPRPVRRLRGDPAGHDRLSVDPSGAGAFQALAGLEGVEVEGLAAGDLGLAESLPSEPTVVSTNPAGEVANDDRLRAQPVERRHLHDLREPRRQPGRGRRQRAPSTSFART